MGRQADCSSRSDISENKSDLPPLTKWPSVKSKGTSKPSMHGKPGKYPCCGGPIFGKNSLAHRFRKRNQKKF